MQRFHVVSGDDSAYRSLMPTREDAQNFLFTFRCNGEAHGQPLTEVLVEELVDYDPSVAADAYKRSWFGTEEALGGLMPQLGFGALDIEGVFGALHDHRDADRKLTITQGQLENAGFREVA